jgi:predicted house-cleaning NTP pyrophosphatase (Maf/HAM1 superfamily)
MRLILASASPRRAELLRGAPLSDGKVTFAWNAAVGPALERVTTVKLERGVLIIDAASAQWSREIQRSSPVILARLQSLLGKDTVSSIIVRAEG